MRRAVRSGVALLLATLIGSCGWPGEQPGWCSNRPRFRRQDDHHRRGVDTSFFSGAEIGAQAYIKQINKTNYLHGIKLKFAGFVNDAFDPATALSGVRQLVNQYGVFAVVPDLSPVNPGSYPTSRRILYVGGGFDSTYCSNKVTTSLWGYSSGGCPAPSSPP